MPDDKCIWTGSNYKWTINTQWRCFNLDSSECVKPCNYVSCVNPGNNAYGFVTGDTISCWTFGFSKAAPALARWDEDDINNKCKLEL